MPAPNGYVGTISSGSGTTYVVTISGLGTVSATCVQIDAGETIPAGTKVLIIKDGSVYKFTVPVFL
jgi:hypothetical protein